MNYEQPDRLEQLAGAYVVGTLRGSARVRFERVYGGNPKVRAAVRRWEDRLMPLLRGIVPITPSAQVWVEIARRTSRQRGATTHGMAPWRWVLAGVLTLCLVVAVSIRILSPPPQQLAAVGPDRTHAIWIIARDADTKALSIRAPSYVQSNPRMAYELWALPAGGRPPVSLGLMPRSGTLRRPLSLLQRAALLQSDHVAVSLEPAGGSPTGSPTGPVLFVADLKLRG